MPVAAQVFRCKSRANIPIRPYQKPLGAAKIAWHLALCFPRSGQLVCRTEVTPVEIRDGP